MNPSEYFAPNGFRVCRYCRKALASEGVGPFRRSPEDVATRRAWPPLPCERCTDARQIAATLALVQAAEEIARAADEALAEGGGNSLSLRIARNLLGCALDEYRAAKGGAA